MATRLSQYDKEFQTWLVMSSTQTATFITDLKAVKLDLRHTGLCHIWGGQGGTYSFLCGGTTDPARFVQFTGKL